MQEAVSQFQEEDSGGFCIVPNLNSSGGSTLLRSNKHGFYLSEVSLESRRPAFWYLQVVLTGLKLS